MWNYLVFWSQVQLYRKRRINSFCDAKLKNVETEKLQYAFWLRGEGKVKQMMRRMKARVKNIYMVTFTLNKL